MVQHAEEEDAIVWRLDKVGQIPDPADPYAWPLRASSRRGGDIPRIGIDADVFDAWEPRRDVGGPAADIENPCADKWTDVVLHQHLLEAPCSDQCVEGTIRRGASE
jgi:hypothetical protein